MKHSPARVLPIVLVTLLAGLAPADEEPTSEAVLDFFKNQIPEAFVILKHVQENEPIDIYQERFDHFSDVFIEYHNLTKEKGKKHADSYLQEIRLDCEIEALTHNWYALAEGDPKRNEIRQKLRGKLLQQVAVEIRRGASDIAELEAEIAEIKERIHDLKTRPQAVLDEQLAEEFGEDKTEED